VTKRCASGFGRRNVVLFQFFYGEESFPSAASLPCRPEQPWFVFRQGALGRSRLSESLLAATIAAAVQIEAVTPVEFERVIGRTPGAKRSRLPVYFPTDSRLLEVARPDIVHWRKNAPGFGGLKPTTERRRPSALRSPALAAYIAHQPFKKRLRPWYSKRQAHQYWGRCCALIARSWPIRASDELPGTPAVWA